MASGDNGKPAWDGGCVERIRRAGWAFYTEADKRLGKGTDLPESLDDPLSVVSRETAEWYRRYMGRFRAPFVRPVHKSAERLIGELIVSGPCHRKGDTPPPPPEWPADYESLDPEARDAIEALSRTFLRLMQRWGWWTACPDGPEAPAVDESPTIDPRDLQAIRAALEALDRQSESWNARKTWTPPKRQAIAQRKAPAADPEPEATFAEPGPEATATESLITPTWDRESRTLTVGGCSHRLFAREAENQMALLDAFQRAGWPPKISRNEAGLGGGEEAQRQTIKDINRNSRVKDCPIRFGRERATITWRLNTVRDLP